MIRVSMGIALGLYAVIVDKYWQSKGRPICCVDTEHVIGG